MDLNTPALRRQIILALARTGVGEWHRKVKGYHVQLVRDGTVVGWSVSLPKTRKTVEWRATGQDTTVFDALASIENVIERRVARTDT